MAYQPMSSGDFGLIIWPPRSGSLPARKPIAYYFSWMVSETIQEKYNMCMKTRLGRQETQLLAYLQLRKLRTVGTGDLTGPLRLTREQERELFRRLARGGLLA